MLAAIAWVPPAVLLARRRRKLGLPAAVSVPLAYSVPVAVAAGLPRCRGLAAAVWAAHMWAYKIAFEVPYDRPQRLRERLWIDQPIAVDARIGGGVVPTQRLQRRLRRPPRLTWLDRALTLVYVLWEAEPHAALAWILMRHPERFPESALRLGATFDATLIGYFAVPSAPPWWASEFEGRMDRAVRRVVAEFIKDVRGKPRPGVDHNSGANPWAAMPSDHFASALATAILLAEADRRAGALGAAYAALLGGTLVYTGEHYVVDLIAGAGLALTVNVVGKSLCRLSPASRRAFVARAPSDRAGSRGWAGRPRLGRTRRRRRRIGRGIGQRGMRVGNDRHGRWLPV